jgi:hypothetical protein
MTFLGDLLSFGAVSLSFFQIFLERKKFAEFKHKIPLNMVNYVFVTGDLLLQTLAWEGNYYVSIQPIFTFLHKKSILNNFSQCHIGAVFLGIFVRAGNYTLLECQKMVQKRFNVIYSLALISHSG